MPLVPFPRGGGEICVEREENAGPKKKKKNNRKKPLFSGLTTFRGLGVIQRFLLDAAPALSPLLLLWGKEENANSLLNSCRPLVTILSERGAAFSYVGGGGCRPREDLLFAGFREGRSFLWKKGKFLYAKWFRWRELFVRKKWRS